MQKLAYRSKMSRRSAKEMIILLAKHGNHGTKIHFKTDAEVKRYLGLNDRDFDALVESCRDPKTQVPVFENLVPATWRLEGTASISSVDLETGQTKLLLDEPGTVTLDGYWGTFENAIRSRDRAVNETLYAEFLSAITQGIASIEDYINRRAELWNSRNLTDKLENSRQAKISLDDKIDKWIPKMAKGQRLMKGGSEWQAFRVLRNLRDDEAIHPKDPSKSIRFSDFANKLNLFGVGIAGLLIQLHIIFAEEIPASVVRARYCPDVELVTMSDTQP